MKWLIAVLTVVLTLASTTTADVPQMINYQGRLTDSTGQPLDTVVAMVLSLYRDSSDVTAMWADTRTAVVVSNGLFNVTLGRYGPLIPDSAFNSPNLWLGIRVGSDPDEINPRTRIAAVAYSFRVNSIDGATGGTISGNVNIQSDLFASGKATIGPGHTNTGNYAFVAGLDNSLTADYATISGGIYDTASGAYSTVGGGKLNRTSMTYATVSGGLSNKADSHYAAISGGRNNIVIGNYGAIAGGFANVVEEDECCSIGGGRENTASGTRCTVGGGIGNLASGWHTTVGGGQQDTATGVCSAIGGGFVNVASGDYSTVAGGRRNKASHIYSTVAGGYGCSAGGEYGAVGGGRFHYNAGDYSVIPGGYCDSLTTGADYSMAFGDHVYVNNPYRVVLFDGDEPGYLGLNRDDRDGGVLHPIHVGTNGSNGDGAHLTAGGVWTNASSRTFKENFQHLDGSDILGRIEELTINSWEYTGTEERHIWPCAEDFHQAFDVGTLKEDGSRDGEYLAAGDVAGVAMIGVQELSRQLEGNSERIKELETRVVQLEEMVEMLLAGQHNATSKPALGMRR